MTSRDFCFWLQGVFELGQPKSFDEVRTEQIRKHLQLVFKHEIDPSMGPPAHQAELDAIHVGDVNPSGASTQPTRPQIGGVGPHGQVYRC